MKHQQLDMTDGFRVAIGNAKAQGAVMVIAPGESEGGPDNRHRGADQWLYVVKGSGVASVDKKQVELSKGSLLLIEAGERHEIRNTGKVPLETVSIYVPPAYSEDGEELPAGKG